MLATWHNRVTPSLTALSKTELHKLFLFPNFTVVLPSHSRYDKLAASVKTINAVKRSETARAHVAVFICDLGIPKNYQEWCWYSLCDGGSALSLGPTFMQSASIAAQQVAFWVGLEQWCRFPFRQQEFREKCTITFVIDNDKVPGKVKRIWVKEFLTALKQYQNGGTIYEPTGEQSDSAQRKPRSGKDVVPRKLGQRSSKRLNTKKRSA